MISLYTDGSAIYSRGRWSAGSGIIAIHESTPQQIRPDILFNNSISLPGATSQIAELYAACYALYTLAQRFSIQGVFDKEIVVVSDSQYVVQGYNQYLVHWIHNGWCKTNGKPVSNREYWESLLHQVRYLERLGTRVRFRKTTAHRNGQGDTFQERRDSECNEIADRLAGCASRVGLG